MATNKEILEKLESISEKIGETNIKLERVKTKVESLECMQEQVSKLRTSVAVSESRIIAITAFISLVITAGFTWIVRLFSK